MGIKDFGKLVGTRLPFLKHVPNEPIELSLSDKLMRAAAQGEQKAGFLKKNGLLKEAMAVDTWSSTISRVALAAREADLTTPGAMRDMQGMVLGPLAKGDVEKAFKAYQGLFGNQAR